MRRALITLLLAAVANGAAASQVPDDRDARTLNLTAYVELLRSDLRTQKVAILTEVMGFTEAEDAAFWPIYRQCDADMTVLADERLALIRDYAAHYSTLSDDDANRLATRAVDLQSRRNAREVACYERVKAAMSARTALRFLQVEHQIQLIIDLQISASLPVAPDGRGRR